VLDRILGVHDVFVHDKARAARVLGVASAQLNTMRQETGQYQRKMGEIPFHENKQVSRIKYKQTAYNRI
jgi:hypothetical protein